jgi:hypothetical protein
MKHSWEATRQVSPWNKELSYSQAQWFTPVDLATEDAEIRRIAVLDQSRQKVSETPFQQTN